MKEDGTGEQVEYYSWHAPDGLSCWDKAHNYYIPKGLFQSQPVPIDVQSPLVATKPRFQKSRVSSELYNMKRLAFGMGIVKRGRQVHKKSRPSRVMDVEINRDALPCNRNRDNNEEVITNREAEDGINISSEESETNESTPNITSTSFVTTENLEVGGIERI